MRNNSTQQHTSIDPKAGKTSRSDIIEIADIAIRNDWQVRGKIDLATVNRYRNYYKNDGTLPPLDIALVDGVYRLVDGWHRLEALRLLDRTTAEVNITEMSMNEARLPERGLGNACDVLALASRVRRARCAGSHASCLRRTVP
jgi:hypothetical protein